MTNEKYINPTNPSDRAAQLIPYLDHIDELRRKMFSYREIAELFGMPGSTFRYALKRARKIVDNDPGLSTGKMIPTQKEDDIVLTDRTYLHEQQDRSVKMEEIKHKEKETINNTVSSQESLSNSHSESTEEEKTEQSKAEWAAEVMRNATPSRYAKNFNIDLKYK